MLTALMHNRLGVVMLCSRGSTFIRPSKIAATEQIDVQWCRCKRVAIRRLRSRLQWLRSTHLAAELNMIRL